MYPSGEPSEWDALLAASTLCCGALTAFLKQRFDEHFVDAFNELLRSHYPTLESIVTWHEAEEALRRHQVTGGLSAEKRRALFEEYRARLD